MCASIRFRMASISLSFYIFCSLIFQIISIAFSLNQQTTFLSTGELAIHLSTIPAKIFNIWNPKCTEIMKVMISSRLFSLCSRTDQRESSWMTPMILRIGCLCNSYNCLQQDFLWLLFNPMLNKLYKKCFQFFIWYLIFPLPYSSWFNRICEISSSRFFSSFQTFLSIS